MALYDSYFVSVRKYKNKIFLQELPYTHCVIDSECYLGYLFSFDLSYFAGMGIDIDGYSPEMKEYYAEAIENRDINYSPHLPNRNGAWCYWKPLSPNEAWVFKWNSNFAGSVPPALDMLKSYNKLGGKTKELDALQDELKTYKVIFATVPRLNNNKGANRQDDFAISANELGKFVNAVKQSLEVDFKATPLDNVKAFDFSPTASEKSILEEAISNTLKENGVAESALFGGSSVSALKLWQTVFSATVQQVYPQFQKFCEHQLDILTKSYKFKVEFEGTIFDKEDRINRSNGDMERGIITPKIFSARGIAPTDATTMMNFMYSQGIPELFRPIKTASTMSSEEKDSIGRTQSNDSDLSDSGEVTRDYGSNIEKGGNI